MSVLLRSIHSLDFYRKIERDLTKGTTVGAILSCVGAVLMVTLFVLEFKDFMTTQVVTEIQLDDFEDSILQININLTVERVACPYLSIDLENVLGTHKANLTRTIRKWKVKTHGPAQRVVKDQAVVQEAHEINVQTDVRADAASFEREPEIVTISNFESFVKAHEYVMINFFAPWCMWSKKLNPVWDETAHELSAKYGTRIGIGKTDCTSSNDQTGLCHMNHITAFPTIVTFHNKDTKTHDYYHGDRTTDAFLSHVEEHLGRATRIDDDDDKVHVISKRESSTSRQEQEKKEFVEYVPAVEGCQIEGYVLVKKVPGNLIVSAVSPKHSFDMAKVNITHVINHLSFGQLYTDEELQMLPKEVTGSMNKLSGRAYVSTGQNQTHEHYLKVVGTLFNYLDAGTLSTYKYTSHSATYHGHTKMPVIKFHYDISPMNVVVTEKFKPFYQFLTSLFAVIGGVFTVFGLMDGMIYNTSALLRKKLSLGKQS